ncbi:ATP-grasp domain-containing protein [Tardiphaga sp. 841_E9_N1_2]|jgi:carbamoyl-phosphate synthase large subunit|uniref:ATP-grasp domain-containing protein n=1 Tax=Tardiphaga sp. 841_E9_N1_2 TaxID=3240762 RepID=UPI003F244938
MTHRLNVLITGVGGRGVGYQLLHAMSLTQGRYRIVCVDAVSFSYGLYLVDSRYIVPLASSPDYIPTLIDIIKRESIDVLLPGTEAELIKISGARDEIEKTGCRPIIGSRSVIDLAFDKAKLYRWLDEQGIGVPRSGTVGNWRALVEEVGFPVVAKPSGNSGGSRNVAILADVAEVEDYIANFPGDRDTIIVQEYVGDAESEYTVGVIIASEGSIIDSIVMRRNLIGLTLGVSRSIGGKNYALSTGYSQGFIVEDKEIQEFCEALSRRMEIVGPANFQLRRHKGTIKIFEVHPRFSGTAAVRAEAGLNEPDIIIRNQVFGEHFGRQPYQTNVAAIRALHTILVPMQDLANVPTVDRQKA